MEIILFSRPGKNSHTEDLIQIMNEIKSRGFSFRVNREFAGLLSEITSERIPDSAIYDSHIGNVSDGAVLVCYGGDGTILEGVSRLNGTDIPVAGINSGHLGFLALAPRECISDVFESIADSSLQIQKRSLIEISDNRAIRPSYALNEISIQRLGATMISIEASVNGDRVATYQGDGIIIATPTGSTAYSLSAGGPIIAPTCQALLITPLAPHNLNIRPIVIPDSAAISLTVSTRGNDASLTIDTHTLRIEDGARFSIQKSRNAISLALPHNITFFDALREKMMWGVDARKGDFCLSDSAISKKC